MDWHRVEIVVNELLPILLLKLDMCKDGIARTTVSPFNKGKTGLSGGEFSVMLREPDDVRTLVEETVKLASEIDEYHAFEM